MEAQARSGGRSVRHTASHGERVGASGGWQQLMDGQWLGFYGMHGWEETLDKAVPMNLQIPADPSVMIIESRKPVLG